jgi:hypothetical protein
MILNVHKLGPFLSTHVFIFHAVLDWNPLFGLGAPALGINFDQQELMQSISTGIHVPLVAILCSCNRNLFSSLRKASRICDIHSNLLFIGDVQNKRHLQSTKNLHEKEGQDYDTETMMTIFLRDPILGVTSLIAALLKD